EKASVNTAIKGITRNKARKLNAMAVSKMRTHSGSAVASVARRARRFNEETAPLISGSCSLTAPVLQQIDQQQENKGKHQYHHGQGRCARIVVLFKFRDNQQRGNLSTERHVAADKDY